MPTPYFERRYTPNGKVAHLISEANWGYPYPRAACGWDGQATYWRGSGSQDEYDRAQALPLCKRCMDGAGTWIVSTEETA